MLIYAFRQLGGWDELYLVGTWLNKFVIILYMNDIYMHGSVSLLLSKHENVTKNSQKITSTCYCTQWRKGMIVDIHDTLCKKPNFDKCSKNDEFSKEFISIWWDNYNAFLIHLRCLSPSTWVVPIHFQITVER